MPSDYPCGRAVRGWTGHCPAEALRALASTERGGGTTLPFPLNALRAIRADGLPPSATQSLPNRNIRYSRYTRYLPATRPFSSGIGEVGADIE